MSELGYRYRDLFVVGSCAAAIFFVASLASERALRATRVLAEVDTNRRLWLLIGYADVLAGGLAGLALCGLSVFDSFRTPRAHLGFTARRLRSFAMRYWRYDQLTVRCNRQICFIGFLTLSGSLQTIEVSHLWHEQ